MKRIVLLALASGMAIAAATPANAALVIGYSLNGGAVTQLASDAATPGSVGYVGNVAGYAFNTGAFGSPVTNQFDLLTQSINIQSSNTTAGTLSVFVTETNLPTLNSGTLMSSFTSNTLTNATATISSYYSTTNALYGGTLLRSTNFLTPGATSATNVVSATGPFSLTTRYDIAFGTGFGNFNGTANVTAVPEPATWAIMLLGFGGMGYAMRRRKTETRVRFA